MVKKNKSNNVVIQAGILAIASMLVRVIGLLYRAPLTAIIGDEGNGYYGTAYNIYTIILMVSSYSMPSAISKLMAQKLAVGEYRNARRVFRCALMYGILVGLIGSGLLYFGAGVLVPDVAVGVLRVFAPTVFLFGILGSLRGYFQARGSMLPTSISQILEQLANAVVSLAAAWILMHTLAGENATRQAQLGAMGSALGTGAGVFVALVFMLYAFQKDQKSAQELIRSDTKGKTDHYHKFFKETLLVITPFMLSGVVMNLTTSLNQTIYMRIMIYLRDVSATTATTLYGIFSNKAVVISNIPISIATAVSSAIIPGISAAFAQNDLEETRTRVGNAIRATALIAIPSAVGLMMLARPITMILFPQMSSLDMASRMLSMVGVTVLFYTVSTITNAALQSIGKMNQPLISAGFALAAQTVVLVFLLVKVGMDIDALAIASILYSVMIFVVNQYYLHRYLKLRQNVGTYYIRPLLCALVMGISARLVYKFVYQVLSPVEALPKGFYLQNLLALMAALICAVAVYAFMLIISGSVSRETLQSLPKGQQMIRVLEKLHCLKKEEKSNGI